ARDDALRGHVADPEADHRPGGDGRQRAGAVVRRALMVAGLLAFPSPHGVTIADEALHTIRTLPLVGAFAVAWSPDGSRLAYTHLGESSGISTVAADGSDDRPVTVGPRLTSVADLEAPGTALELAPAWTPDGAHVIFTRSGVADDGIWEAALDGSGLRRLV